MSEQKTHAEIIEEMRTKAECAKPYDDGIVMMLTDYADRLDAAHKREVDALKQRLAELDAEIAAKDAVIMRLNDAIAEEQRHKMATPENSSEVGNAAKLYEAVRKLRARFYNNEVAYQQRYFAYSGWHWHKKAKEAEKWRVIFSDYRAECDDALGRPARICDKMDRHKAIRDCRVWLKRHGYKLTSRQDDVMMQTIYWLYDETKEAEVRP